MLIKKLIVALDSIENKSSANIFTNYNIFVDIILDIIDCNDKEKEVKELVDMMFSAKFSGNTDSLPFKFEDKLLEILKEPNPLNMTVSAIYDSIFRQSMISFATHTTFISDLDFITYSTILALSIVDNEEANENIAKTYLSFIDEEITDESIARVLPSVKLITLINISMLFADVLEGMSSSLINNLMHEENSKFMFNDEYLEVLNQYLIASYSSKPKYLH